MRLDNYISENTILDSTALIKRDCQPWLKATKNCGFFYRGLKRGGSFEKKSVRKDRIPLNMDQEESDRLDVGFQKKFGWKARSNGVFVTGSLINASGYAGLTGGAYIFFAIGDFKYVWSPRVEDLYTDIPKLMSAVRGLKPKKMGDPLVRAVEEFFIDVHLTSAQKSGKEVVVGCKTYYALDTQAVSRSGYRYDKDLKKLLY